jgi:DNA-binding beta-propeller fold protein YncE
MHTIVGAVVVVALAGPFAPAAPPSQVWVERYDNGGQDYLSAMGVSADGARVFVTGGSEQPGNGDDFATIAYNSSTGVQLWADRYGWPGQYSDAADLAVDPNGSRVFVTGSSAGENGDPGFATIAYDGPSGDRLWVAGYNGPRGLNDGATAIAVSPDGSRIFVTGLSYLGQFHVDFATVAYDAATGRRLWVRLYDFGQVEIANQPADIAVSPDGSTVFVTGESFVMSKDSYDYATVAYDAATGQTSWVDRYDGPAGKDDEPRALAVTPDGSTVVVTGQSKGTTTGYDYATVGYDAATGAERWASRWDGPSHSADLPAGLAMEPGGDAVFVTGMTYDTDSSDDYGTVAYDPSTGAQLWAARFAGYAGGRDDAYAVAVSPGGGRVYVTGTSDSGIQGGYDYGTVAYEGSTGKRLWVHRYDGTGHSNDTGLAVATSPSGSRIFVAGISVGPDLDYDFATLCYRLS